MKIKIKIKCTVVACTLRSPYTHVDYYNYHCWVTVQMSKPWSQLFCLSLFCSLWQGCEEETGS